ncbi:MAG: ribbon-helix-helix domain-containing protein [Pyrinomonadaceae bacterium]
MGRSVISISVPSGLRAYVAKRVATGGFGSASEYFRELVRIDLNQQRTMHMLGNNFSGRRHPDPHLLSEPGRRK